VLDTHRLLYERGVDGEPIDGSDRMLYVETGALMPEYEIDSLPAGVLEDHQRGRAEWLTRALCTELVVSASRITRDEPFPAKARGFGEFDPAFLERQHLAFVQGYAFAKWEPFYHPPDGNWFG
jgi:hypothetical protein